MNKNIKAVFFCLSLGLFSYTAESEAHGHGHDHSHHHHDHEAAHDEEIIAMSDGQIEQFRIEVQKAGPGVLSGSLQARGKIVLHPDRLVHVLPKIPGVAHIARKNIGDKTEKGEILAVLESKEMADIKANFLASKGKERLARSLYEKEKRLYEKKITPELEYLQAKSAYEEARINYQLANQKLKAFDLSEEDICCLADEIDPDLRFYEIRSPISGTILNRHICVGEFVEDKTEIYQIADLDSVWVEIGVFPQDVNKVNAGQSIRIRNPGGKEETDSQLIFVSPLIQNETITAKAVAALDNKAGFWRPGTFVTVTIATETTPAAIIVPKEAIQVIDGDHVVFTKVDEGFEIRKVQLGASDKDHVEIVAGLEAGEEFVAANSFILKAEHGKGEAEHEH